MLWTLVTPGSVFLTLSAQIGDGMPHWAMTSSVLGDPKMSAPLTLNSTR